MRHQLLLPLNTLLGKPNNTCRTTCKTNVTYRMTLRSNFSGRDWELNSIQSYDEASVGSSALLAALGRNLKAELAVWLKQHFAAIPNNYEQYIATLELIVLMHEAVFPYFPLPPLACALQQHMAPRVLQAHGGSSTPLCVNWMRVPRPFHASLLSSKLRTARYRTS